ncbi:hypothetical protein [Halocola ammonii]
MKSLLVLFALLFTMQSFAQEDYQLITEEDGVEVYAKIGREKWLDKDSPKILMIWVKNTSDEDVIYEVGAEFFFKMALQETFPPQEFCVNAGRSKKGKLDGIYFKSCDLTNEQILGENFDYEVLFEIKEKGVDCSSYSKE